MGQPTRDLAGLDGTEETGVVQLLSQQSSSTLDSSDISHVDQPEQVAQNAAEKYLTVVAPWAHYDQHGLVYAFRLIDWQTRPLIAARLLLRLNLWAALSIGKKSIETGFSEILRLYLIGVGFSSFTQADAGLEPRLEETSRPNPSGEEKAEPSNRMEAYENKCRVLICLNEPEPLLAELNKFCDLGNPDGWSIERDTILSDLVLFQGNRKEECFVHRLWPCGTPDWWPANWSGWEEFWLATGSVRNLMVPVSSPKRSNQSDIKRLGKSIDDLLSRIRRSYIRGVDPVVTPFTQQDIDLGSEAINRLAGNNAAFAELRAKISTESWAALHDQGEQSEQRGQQQISGSHLGAHDDVIQTPTTVSPDAATEAVEQMVSLNQSLGKAKLDNRNEMLARTEQLEHILNRWKDLVFGASTGVVFAQELLAAMARLNVSLECHECHKPAGLRYSRIPGSPEKEWRFVHGLSDLHGVVVNGDLQFGSVSLPHPLVVVGAEDRAAAKAVLAFARLKRLQQEAISKTIPMDKGAEVLQAILGTIARHERGSMDENQQVVSQVNDCKLFFNLSLFAESHLETKVSLGFLADAAHPRGRFTITASKKSESRGDGRKSKYQARSFSSTFPALFLGRETRQPIIPTEWLLE